MYQHCWYTDCTQCTQKSFLPQIRRKSVYNFRLFYTGLFECKLRSANDFATFIDFLHVSWHNVMSKQCIRSIIGREGVSCDGHFKTSCILILCNLCHSCDIYLQCKTYTSRLNRNYLQREALFFTRLLYIAKSAVKFTSFSSYMYT